MSHPICHQYDNAARGEVSLESLKEHFSAWDVPGSYKLQREHTEVQKSGGSLGWKQGQQSIETRDCKQMTGPTNIRYGYQHDFSRNHMDQGHVSRPQGASTD